MSAAFGVLPIAGIKSVIRRRGNLAAYAEQRPERVERVKAAVKSECKFVQVGLKMLFADAVMAAAKPSQNRTGKAAPETPKRRQGRDAVTGHGATA